MNTSAKHKVVVVTGGGSGIGYEIANSFLQKEAKIVIILDITENQGKEAERTLNNKYGEGKACFIKCDVTKDLEEVSKRIFDTYETVDVLVNNAGVLAENSIQRSIDVNVKAVMEFTYKFHEYMRKDKGCRGGTIINISSIYGFRIIEYSPIYQGTKFAVLGFSKSLGHSYNYNRTGVRVLTVCPGLTLTNLGADGKAACTREEETREDCQNYLQKFYWQEPEVLGRGTVEVYEKAESGTAWLIEEDNPPVEVK